MNPYVFIVGCPRSGTTLLRRIVDAHPRIAITRETHWITQLLAGGVYPGRPVGPEILGRLATEKRFTRMDADHAALERMLARREPVSYSEFVTTVFDLYGKSQGKALVGDKVPGYVRDIPVLHELFPHARFVHLIRDGRDVCSSVRAWKRKQPPDRVATIAGWWEERVRAGREAGSALGPGLYRELRYEELVADPEHACRELCGFLDVPYSERMLAFHECHDRRRPVTRGLRDWRTELPQADVAAFEAAAGGLLGELGYAR